VGRPSDNGDDAGNSGGGVRRQWEVVAKARGGAGGVRQWRGHHRLTGRWINDGDDNEVRVRVLSYQGETVSIGLEDAQRAMIVQRQTTVRWNATSTTNKARDSDPVARPVEYYPYCPVQRRWHDDIATYTSLKHGFPNFTSNNIGSLTCRPVPNVSGFPLRERILVPGLAPGIYTSTLQKPSNPTSSLLHLQRGAPESGEEKSRFA
jgi:hypothetical protein